MDQKRQQVNGDKVLDTTQDLKVYKLEELNKHNTAGDSWLVLEGLVYDVS